MSVAEARTFLAQNPDAEAYLPLRHYTVLRLRAGGLTLAQIGEHRFSGFGYDLSRERIRQIEGEAIRLLKKATVKDTPQGLYLHERFGRA